MNPRPRVTQKTIAAAVGNDQSTVSLALRYHPSIPAGTRDRIFAAAERLGYRPDPMLSALSAYRNQTRTTKFQGTMGWLADSRHGVIWRNNPALCAIYDAARQHAEKLGYKTEIFDLKDLRNGLTSAARIARSRGIQGFLVCPQPLANTRLADFPWEWFTAVTFGYTLEFPRLDAVGTDYVQVVSRILEELRLRGYQRIGLAMPPEHARRIRFAYTAAYLAFHHQWEIEPALPVCPDDGEGTDGTVLRAWILRHQPDAIIAASNPHIVTMLNRWGISVPDQLGVTWSILPNDDTLSGVRENTSEVGRNAVELLVSTIHHGGRGIPTVPKRILIDGIWNAGCTIRASR